MNWLNSCSERMVVDSLMVTSDKYCSSRAGIEPVLLNSSVNNVKSGTKWLLSKFVGDSRLCGAVDTLKECYPERYEQT